MAYHLTVNGMVLDRVGFCTATDLTDLIQRAGLRGPDWTSDGVDGDTFLPKPRGSLTAMIGLELEGDVDSTGAARAQTGWSGIRANAQEIDDACVEASKDGEVTIAVTYDDGVVQSAPGYCRRLDVGLFQNDKTGAFAAAVLEIHIPSGRLV